MNDPDFDEVYDADNGDLWDIDIIENIFMTSFSAAESL